MLAVIQRRLGLTGTLQSRRLSARPAPSSTPPHQLTSETAIRSKLTERFAPSELLVQDVSGGCGSFYAITIASQAFKGLTTVKQHRLVAETLKLEIEGIHGLQIKTIPQ